MDGGGGGGGGVVRVLQTVPEGVEGCALRGGEVRVLQEAGRFVLEIEAGDDRGGDDLFEGDGEFGFGEEEGLSVLEGVSGLEAAAERGVRGDDALEDFADLALAEEVDSEVAERIVFDGGGDGDEGEEFGVFVQEAEVSLSDALGTLEVFDVGTGTVDFKRADEGFEVLVAAFEVLFAFLHILLHPGNDGFERMDGVSGLTIDRALHGDLLREELLHGLV